MNMAEQGSNMPREKAKETNSQPGWKLFILPGMMLFCTVFYYFGELVDWATWNALRQDFFYGIHDIHRVLFLAPIIYAAHTARVKGALIITLVSLIIFMPRAFFISPFPDPLLRIVLFTTFAGLIGILVGIFRNRSERCRQLEAILAAERDRLLKILGSMADGVLITGPDYKIRFMNSYMIKNFGDGIGLPCYQHLYHLDAPCGQECKIPEVIENGQIGCWECSFPNGTRYEITAAPYIDADGTTCQISIFRNVAACEKSKE